MNDEQLTQRMRAAAEALQMSDSSQARHLEAISAVLASSGTPSDAPVIPLATAGATRRRRIVASVVAAAVMAPTGLAAASERSVPGDALYPVKQISERVLVLFDSDVIAEHRVEEIEALEAVGRFDAELYDDARAALTELGEDHPLWQRLAAATPPNDGDADPAISDDDRSQDDSTGVVVAEIVLPGGAEATVTLADGRLVNIDVPKGWTVTEIDDDDATLEHDDYIVELEVSPDGSVELDVTERDDRDSDDDDAGANGTTDASDDDQSSDSETTSTTEAGQRADDSDSAEPASNDDDRRDDDLSESP